MKNISSLAKCRYLKKKCIFIEIIFWLYLYPCQKNYIAPDKNIVFYWIIKSVVWLNGITTVYYWKIWLYSLQFHIFEHCIKKSTEKKKLLAKTMLNAQMLKVIIIIWYFSRQIEELTQHINKTELTINDLCDENEDLRGRLGLDPRKPLDLTKYRSDKKVRMEEEKAMNYILQKEVSNILEMSHVTTKPT
jgi:hypothetical protein